MIFPHPGHGGRVRAQFWQNMDVHAKTVVRHSDSEQIIVTEKMTLPGPTSSDFDMYPVGVHFSAKGVFLHWQDTDSQTSEQYSKTFFYKS